MAVYNPNPNFQLNGSSSSLSLVAGANIALASNASTITISGSVQTISQSLTALGNTTSSSAGTFSGLLNISGAGAVSVGVGAGSITISSPIATNFVLNGSSSSLSLVAGSNIGFASNASTITISGSNQVQNFGISSSTAAGGTTAGTTTVATGPILLVAGSNINLSSSGGAITISASAGAGAAGTQTLSVGAASVTGTAVSLALVAGANISLATASGAGVLTVTISDMLTSRQSLTQNAPLQAAALLTSTAGTITGTAGFGSSLFLQRVWLEADMNLSEGDLAIGLSFPVTSQGAGTLSRSLVLYSFGNSTSLASVLSFSSTSAWTTGTVTAGGSVSLTQFQGGWAGSLIWPMTFASTSILAGEYVVGNLINFAQGSSTWSLSLFGPNAAAASTATIVSGVNSSTTSYYSSVAGLALSNYEQSSNTHAGSAVSAIATNVSLSTKTFSVQARTFFSASTTTGNLVSSLSGLSATITYLGGSTLPNFGFIGTGSTTSAFPYWFSAGIMSTGAVPAAITLTSAAVTYLGSAALLQPWWALAGA